MATLTDVMGVVSHGVGGGGRSMSGGASVNGPLDVEEDTLVGVVVDWIVGNVKNEADEHHRTLKYDLIRLGIEGFGMLEEGYEEG